ncbi:MAG: hypothetical protein ACP5QO_09925 [Clostridia bacterium]
MAWALGTIAARLPFPLAALVAILLVTSAASMAARQFRPDPLLTKWARPLSSTVTKMRPILSCFRELYAIAVLLMLAGGAVSSPWLEIGAAAFLLMTARWWTVLEDWLVAASLWLVVVGLVIALIGSWGLSALTVHTSGAFPTIAVAPVALVLGFTLALVGPDRGRRGVRSWQPDAVYASAAGVTMAVAAIAARRFPVGGVGPVILLTHVMGPWHLVALLGLLAGSLVAAMRRVVRERSAPAIGGTWGVFGAASALMVLAVGASAAGLERLVPAWGPHPTPVPALMGAILAGSLTACRRLSAQARGRTSAS